MTRTGGSMMEGGSPSSGREKTTAMKGERRRRAEGGRGPEHRRGEGAEVGAGAAGEAGAEASEEIEEAGTGAAVVTGGRWISLLLRNEEEALSGDQTETGATGPEADLLTDGDTDDIMMMINDVNSVLFNVFVTSGLSPACVLNFTLSCIQVSCNNCFISLLDM